MKETFPVSEKGSGDSAIEGEKHSGFLRIVFRDRLIFWILVPLLVGADLWTKHAFFAFVDLHTSELVHDGGANVYWVCNPWFGLVQVENSGGPFGSCQSFPFFLKILRFVALGVILYLLISTPRGAKVQMTALALIMGGALGNIWDSFYYGAVRDFLYFRLGFWPADPWPAFNLADSLICTGVFLLAFCMITAPPQNRPAKENG